MQSYFERFVLDGGIMMVFLIPTSILALGYAIHGFIALRREKIAPRALIERARHLQTEAERRDFREALRNDSSPLGQVVDRVLAHPKGNPGDGEAALEEAVAAVADRLDHQTMPLAVIYTVAPLMGLLGTILGMMRTFYEFAVREERSVALLSEGINEALVTTMWGLFIAIPAYLFLSIFRHRIFLYEKDILPEAARLIVPACSEGEKSPTRHEEGRAR
jgi:biopolymer transport protein ExbB